MRLFVQEMRKYTIEHSKGLPGCTATELVKALQFMPAGYVVSGLQNREDGTTIVTCTAQYRTQINKLVGMGD